MTCVLQPWVLEIPMMQQTVLLTAIRGPDGLPKYGNIKMLLRWYRRCILYTAMDHVILETPHDTRGGSFTGPSFRYTGRRPDLLDWTTEMNQFVSGYLQDLDAIPHHFQLHFLHGAEILGYKHPTKKTRDWWLWLYHTLVNDMHLAPETEKQLDYRLGDNESQWRSTAHKATQD